MELRFSTENANLQLQEGVSHISNLNNYLTKRGGPI